MSQNADKHEMEQNQIWQGNCPGSIPREQDQALQPRIPITDNRGASNGRGNIGADHTLLSKFEED